MADAEVVIFPIFLISVFENNPLTAILPPIVISPISQLPKYETKFAIDVGVPKLRGN